MSDASFDLTARTRIRALAARMHRAKIADVFSIAGGAPAVDESQLDADQRLAASNILREVDANSITVEDVATASRVVAMVSRYTKSSCPTCHGSGLVRRDNVDDFCICVDRRWQAAVDHEALVDGFRAPGRTAGAHIESTRADDYEQRIAAARKSLAWACAAASAACADLDSKIKALEVVGAPYFAERGRLDASRAGSKALAEEQERLAGASAQAAAEAQDRVEAIALRIGQLIEPLFLARAPASADDDRAQAHAAIDEVYTAAAEGDNFRAEQQCVEKAARCARIDERSCERQIAALDADNVTLVGVIERLRAERTRIARHHEPKVERARKRLNRLQYLRGDGPDVTPEDVKAEFSQGGVG